MKEKIDIQYIDVGLLNPAEYNPRKWNDAQIAQLKKSIEKFGVVDPIIVNSSPDRKNIVIGGHFRLYCCKELGMTKVPVVYVDIADIKTEQELNIRLNKNSGEFDWDLLANFDEDMLLEVGFTDDELEIGFDLEFNKDDKEDQEKLEELAPKYINCPHCGKEFDMNKHAAVRIA